MAWDYEVLLHAGDSAAQYEVDYPILPVDFGDGYTGSALIGDVNGLYGWTINWGSKHLYLKTVTGRTYLNVAVGSAVPIPQYLNQFFYRRMSGNITGSANEPFWWRASDHITQGSRTLRLCEMTHTKIKITQDRRNPYLYNCSFSFREVRGKVAQSV